MEKGKFRISRYLAQQLQEPGKPAAKCRGIFEGRGLGTFRLCLLVFARSAACCCVFLGLLQIASYFVGPQKFLGAELSFSAKWTSKPA